MNRMSWMVATLAVAWMACEAVRPPAAEPLYFALELRHQGKLVGRPKLLGEAGKTVRAERRQPDEKEPDYRLVLQPTFEGDPYRVRIQLEVPHASGNADIDLLHGEERRLSLGSGLEVSVLLMRVDSPEFRAVMDLAAPLETGTGSI